MRILRIRRRRCITATDHKDIDYSTAAASSTILQGSSEIMTKHTLLYFGIMGRAEPIRLAFVQAGVPFTNKAITPAEFAELKPSLPCGQLPAMEIEDGDAAVKMMDQSNAIMRYVGKLNGSGLYPSDPFAALTVDMVIDTVEEATKFLTYSLVGPKGIFFSEETLSDEAKIDIRKKILDPSIPRNMAYFLGVLEKRLDENEGGWFVGDTVTIADLRAHQLVSWLMAGILDGIPTNAMDTYPLLKALHDKVEALPAIAAFRSKYGKKYTTFDYIPGAE